jgi:hypothetical protein
VFVIKNLTSALSLISLALLSVAQAATDFDPEPFEARFEVEVRGFTVGETAWSVRRSADGFVYETRTKAVGLALMFGDRRVVERSEWKRVGDDVKPAYYRYQRSDRSDKNTTVVFHWNEGVVENTRRGLTSRVSVPFDTLDKLGYMLVLIEDLRAGKRSLRYHIADGKTRMKTYRLKVVGEERMKTALGTFGVLKIVRERKDDDDRDTTVWVAPELGFMPVRIEHRERDDEEVTIKIRSLSRQPVIEGDTGAELKTQEREVSLPDAKR